MSLVKTSILNGIAVAVKILSSIVLNKILAVYVGPSGYAVIGQFQNAVSILVSLAGGILTAGITKATAEHYDNQKKQHEVWRTALRFSLVTSLVGALFLLLIGDRIGEKLLHRSDMAEVFVWLAISLPAIAANNLLLAVVNGKKEIGIYVTSNIIGSLVGISVTGLLAYYFGLYGTLVAFAINPAIVLLATAAIVSQRKWFDVNYFLGQFDKTALRELSGFALMGLTSALTVPLSYMLIRDHLVTSQGLSAAGYWQASWKISEIYLMLITATLSVYYLPRLAEIKTAIELKIEIFKLYRFVMPVVIAMAVIIYFLRDIIIFSLFTPEFMPMRELFAWQLIGDVVKIASWIPGYIMVGRGMVKVFVIVEITFSIIFVFLSWMLVDKFGTIGVPMAYAINYLFFWIAMVILVKHEMRIMTMSGIRS